MCHGSSVWSLRTQSIGPLHPHGGRRLQITKMTINGKIIRNKVGLLNLAEELGNVSKACQMMGMSRDTFYRYKNAMQEGGVDALLDKSRRVAALTSRTAPMSASRNEFVNSRLNSLHSDRFAFPTSYAKKA